MIMPVTLSVITSSFRRRSAQAIGIWAGVAGAGGMLGMFVAAFMFDVATWRWAFLLPIADPTSRDAHAAGGAQHPRARHPPSTWSARCCRRSPWRARAHPRRAGRGWGTRSPSSGSSSASLTALAFVAWGCATRTRCSTCGRSRRGLAAGSLTILLLFAVMFGVLVLFPFFRRCSAGPRCARLWRCCRGIADDADVGARPRLAQRIGSRVTMLIGLAIARPASSPWRSAHRSRAATSRCSLGCC